ncbi:MAG: hypothetical protein ACE5OZ_04220 [Candidatus Heimdallarchaeota archaeon]
MDNLTTFLIPAIIGGLITLVIREIAVWLPNQKDREIKHLEKLVSEVWGPLVTIQKELMVFVKKRQYGTEILFPEAFYKALLNVRNRYYYETSAEEGKILNFVIKKIRLSPEGTLKTTIEKQHREFCMHVFDRWNCYAGKLLLLRNMRNHFFYRFYPFSWKYKNPEEIFRAAARLRGLDGAFLTEPEGTPFFLEIEKTGEELTFEVDRIREIRNEDLKKETQNGKNVR